MSATIAGFLDVSVDPISWAISQLSGAIKLSDTTTTVSVTGAWIQKPGQVPWATVYHKSKNRSWVQIGAGRARYNTNLGVRLWAKTQADRDAMYRYVVLRVSDAAKKYSAAGFIWTDVIDSRPMNEVDKVPPLFSTDITLRVIYDETISYP